MTIYKDKDLEQELQSLNNWFVQLGQLTRVFEFEDFKASMVFVTKVADLAEAAQHHPDIMISYNKVALSMCTHDQDDQITDKDIELAKKISAL